MADVAEILPVTKFLGMLIFLKCSLAGCVSLENILECYIHRHHQLAVINVLLNLSNFRANIRPERFNDNVQH